MSFLHQFHNYHLSLANISARIPNELWYARCAQSAHNERRIRFRDETVLNDSFYDLMFTRTSIALWFFIVFFMLCVAWIFTWTHMKNGKSFIPLRAQNALFSHPNSLGFSIHRMRPHATDVPTYGHIAKAFCFFFGFVIYFPLSMHAPNMGTMILNETKSTRNKLRKIVIEMHPSNERAANKHTKHTMVVRSFANISIISYFYDSI